MSEETDATENMKRTKTDGAGTEKAGESPENADTRATDSREPGEKDDEQFGKPGSWRNGVGERTSGPQPEYRSEGAGRGTEDAEGPAADADADADGGPRPPDDTADDAEGAGEPEKRNGPDGGARERKAGAERQATVFSPDLRVTDPAHSSMLQTLQESGLDVEALLHDALLETFRTELYEKYREALADAEKKQRRREMKAKQRKAREKRRKAGGGSPGDNGTGR